MKLEEIKIQLRAWQETISDLEDQLDALSKIVQACPESPLINAIHRIESRYTRSVARLVGDDNEWLDWYWLEVDMGSKEHNTVTLNNGDDVRNIKTTDDLAQLIYDLADGQN
ncbi:hypothetical protein ABO04_05170 [Nitrosomonas sp. HPC101]|uniref:hypothetical protein n=1 Tax=Nitrosomonas sp. HPC101 TaxID=1658667 RepID=UPI001367C201|nr:hypothetical protein [Nitrosomonas sp. HPC101]MXS85325.1 hypothetical protein [Nitrosomonas sp. HPC101]